MIHYRQIYFRNGGGRSRLGLFVGVALAVALAIALVVLSLGLALILLPVVAVALAIGRWRLNKLMAEARERGGWPGSDNDTRTIETDYRVIDEPDRR